MSIFSDPIENVAKWAQASSLWYYSVGGGCCADELISAQACRYDLERFGCLPQAHPEQADLLIVNTLVTEKMAGVILEIYSRMPLPRYVMAVGACALTCGAFSDRVSYSKPKPLDEIIPVDVYVPGCPPRPEAIMDGLIQLQKKIRMKGVNDRAP